MASISLTLLLFFATSIYVLEVSSNSVIEDLNNQHPPPDFNTTIANKCLNNPSIRYCNHTSADIPDIFKSIIVAEHLCNESKNLGCPDSFTMINLQNRPKIAPLYLSFNFFWKYCPVTILSIFLSNNSIEGAFPSDIFQCSQMEALDLSHNQLTGDAPIESLMSLPNLTFLNLSYNHFSEVKISDTQFFQHFNSSSFIHSGLLPDYHKFTLKAVFLLIGFPLFVILTVGFWSFICFRRPDYLPSFLCQRRKFTSAMLKAATNGFSGRNLVAKMGDLEIYRGTLRDGTEVRIEIYTQRISKESSIKFVEECKVLVQLQHENLVQVLGWWGNRRSRAIVTEWTDGENIDTWLSYSPTWKQRLQVVMGVVEGMSYLYEQWPELEYDLSTSSVCLSKETVPLISRFKVVQEDNSTHTQESKVQITISLFFSTVSIAFSNFSGVSEISQFGVFLLEIMSNKCPNNNITQSITEYVDWTSTNYPENVWKVIDERLKKTGITEDQAANGIGLALMCIDRSTEQQPSLVQIADAVTMLYDSVVPATPNRKRRPHKERGKHERLQSR
ncbi:hypothetical protein Sjap_003806 [Stephania japonica]|uniref:Protein kinase domain-containing protein n=1 Tax=Stephania japonica TaxID=461633 RepID=A0AAP0PXJ5_9MAGN